MKELLSLARLTGKTSEELEALLYEQGELKANWDSEFTNLVLDKFKEQERRAKDDHYKRGVKEKAQEVERALKPLFDKYGIEAGRVEEGLEQLAEKVQAEPPAGGAEELTPEQLRNHPQFKAAVQHDIEKLSKQMNELKAKAAKAEADKEAFIKAREGEQHAAAVKSHFRKELSDLKAYFGKDENKAMEAFLAIYPADKFPIKDGEVIPLDDNGQPATDKFGDPLHLKDFLKENWFLGFSEHSTKTPAPETKGTPGAHKKYFASEEEYNKRKNQLADNGQWDKIQELDKQYLEQLNNVGF